MKFQSVGHSFVTAEISIVLHECYAVLTFSPRPVPSADPGFCQRFNVISLNAVQLHSIAYISVHFYTDVTSLYF